MASLIALACGASFATAPAHAVPFTTTRITVPGLGGISETGLALADFNEDGRTDIVYVARSGNVSVLLRNAAGGYDHAPGSPFALNQAQVEGPLRVADLDRDGHLDLIVEQRMPNVAASSASIQLGRGDGTFGPLRLEFWDGGQGTLAVGDVNGDGVPDIVAPVSGDPVGRLVVKLGVGDGTFGGELPGSAATDHAAPSDVELGDYDGDGLLDAAVSHMFTQQAGLGPVTILRGDGAGHFTRAGGSPYNIGGSTFVLSAGDIDGDGRLDLAAPIAGPDTDHTLTVGTLFGEPNGMFRHGPADSFLTPSAYNPDVAFALPLGDLDGDGRLDAILPSSFVPGDIPRPGIWPVLNDVAGRFILDASAPITTRKTVGAAVIGDLDGDGRPDAVVAAAGPNSGDSTVLHVLTNTGRQAIAVAPGGLDVGSAPVGTAASATVSISNPGDYGLRIRSVDVSGTDAADFAATGCTSRPIAAGRSCDLTVAFTARAEGARAATLTIDSDAPDSGPQTVALTATGTPAPTRPGGGDPGGNPGGDPGGNPGGDGGNPGGRGGTPPAPGTGGGTDPGGGRTGGGTPGATAALRITTKPVRISLARGKRTRVAVTVRNSGTRPATAIALCPRASARQLTAGRCIRIGTLAAGRSVRRTLTVRLAGSARPGRTYTLTLTAKSGAARPATARVRVRARR
jgi:FG-GAP-like repeat